jgi:hypothetical protein
LYDNISTPNPRNFGSSATTAATVPFPEFPSLSITARLEMEGGGVAFREEMERSQWEEADGITHEEWDPFITAVVREFPKTP